MSRRGRRPRSSGQSESLMEFFLRSRAATDAEIDRDIQQSCARKQQYASEADARAHMAMNGMKLSTYHCRYCDFWHLTRRPTSGDAPTSIIDD
jgi:hypothetical protein